MRPLDRAERTTTTLANTVNNRAGDVPMGRSYRDDRSIHRDGFERDRHEVSFGNGRWR